MEKNNSLNYDIAMRLTFKEGRPEVEVYYLSNYIWGLVELNNP